MGIFDTVFGRTAPNSAVAGTQQQIPGQGQPPINPNLAARNPNDPSLSPQQRNDVLQAQAASKAANTNNPSQAVVGDFAPGTTGAAQNPMQPQKQNSPLDDFSKIWENPPTTDSRPNKAFKYPTMDPKKLRAGVEKMDFAAQIPDDILSKAIGGDVASFRQALNSVGRTAFETGFQATDKYNSQLFSSYDESIGERIPNEVRGIQSQARVFQDMKSLDHPAVAPILKVMTAQFQQMYPDATPDEIAANAKKYMVAVAQTITGQIESDTTTQTQAANQRNQGGRGNSRMVSDFSDFENH